MMKSNKTIDFTAFEKKYPSNEKCLEKIYKIRWKNGYKCPRCHYNEAWDIAPYKYKCRNCGYQTTVTAGTFFHRTHLTMVQWFKAIYYMSIRREQATAVELQNLVGIGSNKTALSVLKKVKPMLYCTSQKRLSWKENKLKGIVEMCKETIFDDPYNLKYVYIAVEANNGVIGRIRIVEIPTQKNEQEFYKALVSMLIDKKATVRYQSQQISCPLAAQVRNDFDKWRKCKESYGLDKLRSGYCKMINTYKTIVTFDEILKNILSDTQPPKYKSSLI